jgi:hypothetical protein
MEAVDEPTTEQETSQEGKAMPDKPPDTTEINDSEEGGNNKTTATFKEFDDEGKAIEIKDPSKITWSATPAHALTLKPDPKTGSCEITAVEGTEGDFQVVATDSESGKSGSGHVVVKSSKEHSHVEFGG